MFAKIVVENEVDEGWYVKFDTFDDLEAFIGQWCKPNTAITIYPSSTVIVPNKKCWTIIISKKT